MDFFGLHPQIKYLTVWIGSSLIYIHKLSLGFEYFSGFCIFLHILSIFLRIFLEHFQFLPGKSQVPGSKDPIFPPIFLQKIGHFDCYDSILSFFTIVYEEHIFLLCFVIGIFSIFSALIKYAIILSNRLTWTMCIYKPKFSRTLCANKHLLFTK